MVRHDGNPGADLDHVSDAGNSFGLVGVEAFDLPSEDGAADDPRYEHIRPRDVDAVKPRCR